MELFASQRLAFRKPRVKLGGGIGGCVTVGFTLMFLKIDFRKPRVKLGPWIGPCGIYRASVRGQPLEFCSASL